MHGLVTSAHAASLTLWKGNVCPEIFSVCRGSRLLPRAPRPILWEPKSLKFPGEVMVTEWIKGWS